MLPWFDKLTMRCIFVDNAQLILGLSKPHPELVEDEAASYGLCSIQRRSAPSREGRGLPGHRPGTKLPTKVSC
jgi:hypothetical protein